MLLALAGCNPNSAPGSVSPKTTAPDHPLFLARHWGQPLSPQGAAPGHFSQLETSLAPAACGACHPRQFEDWKTALHSQAMSPGLLGQLREMGAGAGDEHQACLQCHAPLAEQGEHLQKALAGGKRAVPAGVDGVSSAHGLTCAGCHVRARQVYGPRRKDGTIPAPDAKLPHNSWQATEAFEDSRFCAACHQFEPDGPALNGKLLENTYEEWRASRHAREKRSCQSCHMPDRRHLWRGIHDPEMVKSGLEIQPLPLRVDGGKVRAGLEIANRGVGHYFPTYVTPLVIVEITQKDRAGKIIPGTARRQIVARSVSIDLTEELSDTRIAPDEVRRFAYDEALNPRATQIGFKVTVEPDAFYADFYRATLNDAGFQRGREEIKKALKNAQNSPYVLFEGSQRLVQ